MKNWFKLHLFFVWKNVTELMKWTVHMCERGLRRKYLPYSSLQQALSSTVINVPLLYVVMLRLYPKTSTAGWERAPELAGVKNWISVTALLSLP